MNDDARPSDAQARDLARKSALRRRHATARAERDDAVRTAAGEAVRAHVLALPEVRAARVVAAYVATAREVPTARLLADLHEAGVTVLLPVVLPDLDLDWAPYAGPSALAVAGRGVAQPTTAPLGVTAVTGADVVLVPGVAADRSGNRLGRGGGSYDRALTRVPDDRLVAVLLYDGELVDEVPSAAHDQRVGAVVTPGGVHRVPRG